MEIFNNKNYLKRADFLTSIDIDKIKYKLMTVSEAVELLEKLEIEISKHDYDEDSNFLMNPRRKVLKRMIEERLQKNSENKNEIVCESLFNFFEFISDEYSGVAVSDLMELGMTIQEFDKMDMSYRKRGIICAQEKDVILEIINIIKKYINERKTV